MKFDPGRRLLPRASCLTHIISQAAATKTYVKSHSLSYIVLISDRMLLACGISRTARPSALQHGRSTGVWRLFSNSNDVGDTDDVPPASGPLKGFKVRGQIVVCGAAAFHWS
jgi:hypothetical protein